MADKIQEAGKGVDWVYRVAEGVDTSKESTEALQTLADKNNLKIREVDGKSTIDQVVVNGMPAPKKKP